MTRSGALDLTVEELEGGGQHRADVGHVDEHQRDPYQGVEHGHHLAQVCAGGEVTIADGGEDCHAVHQGTAEGPYSDSGKSSSVTLSCIILI